MRRLLFLVDFSPHIQGSRMKGYFEVVLEGEEGQFLEDPAASHEGEVGNILKLGGFWRYAIERETDRSPYRNF